MYDVIMIVDGNKIAEEILKEQKKRVETLGCSPRLTVIMAGDDPSSVRFLNIKKKKAEEIGIDVEVHRFRERVVTEEIIELINSLEETSILVQLPLPENVEATKVLDSIPEKEDVDVLATRSHVSYLDERLTIYPPVIGAMRDILKRHDINVAGKRVAVIGRGSLVGKPAKVWLTHDGAEIYEIDKYTDEEDVRAYLQAADIIISGAGKPGLIRPDMIRDGVIILDAGTSESEGEQKGDADPECAERASLFTPTPGGIGPVTVAILLRNVIDYSIERAKAKESFVN